jgi:hypothetical protein
VCAPTPRVQAFLTARLGGTARHALPCCCRQAPIEGFAEPRGAASARRRTCAAHVCVWRRPPQKIKTEWPSATTSLRGALFREVGVETVDMEERR